MAILRIIGPGRAGSALALALSRAGWTVAPPVTRDDDPGPAAVEVDLVVIATPDAAIADVASRIDPVPTTVVAHLAGSLGLDALAPHALRAAVHPLVSMPTAEVGAERLAAGAWFAVAGDEMARRVVADLGGRAFEVADDDRAAYHAAACIASNHLVGLLGQVERVAAAAAVPLDAYLDLVRATVDNVGRLGPAAALTGPAARGDWATIERHRGAIAAMENGDDELATYDAMVRATRRLVSDDGVPDLSRPDVR